MMEPNNQKNQSIKEKIYGFTTRCRAWQNSEEVRKKMLTVGYPLLMLLTPLLICSLFFYGGALDRRIKSFIMNNPMVIVESLQKMQQGQAAKSEDDLKEKAQKIYDKLSTDASLPFIGKKDSKNIIVSFHDYSCHFCKKMYSEFESLLKAHPDTKIILLEMPVLSMASLNAARLAVYVYNNYPAKYPAFHKKLMSPEFKSMDNGTLSGVAESFGIPKDKAVAAIESKEYDEMIRQSYMYANDVGANGTPILFIKGKYYPGYINGAALNEALGY